LVTEEDQRQLLASFNEILEGAGNRHHDFEARTVAGSRRTLAVWLAQVHGVGITMTIADVSDRARRERELAYSANHDATTGLPNRGALFSRGKHAVRRAARRQTSIGVLFCDLDGFKQLNDLHGHSAGDDLLTAFGARLLESCRASDTVARVGGDEFAVVLEDDVSEESLAAVAERIVTAAAAPFDLSVGRVVVTASVGAVITRVDAGITDAGAEVDRLIGHADMAMYHAKSLGKNRWSRFSASMERLPPPRVDFAEDIRSGRVYPTYQPQFGRSGELVGAEALLRWSDPARGEVAMREMIAEFGGIPPTVAQVGLELAIGELATWTALLPPGFRLSLNLSREQWLNPGLVDGILGALQSHGLAGRLLRLEVDPEALEVNPDASAQATRELSAAGVEVVINGLNFAETGLLSAQRFDISGLALGGRMSRDAVAANGALLRGLVALGRQLGWRVTATGVETDEQLEAVRAAGCAAVQGFVLGRPLAGPQFLAQHLTADPRAEAHGRSVAGRPPSA
jgi:diguanylate cyclase (GGDEF)-like protein